jgi:nucleotide-binding universal stress UspA family protein
MDEDARTVGTGADGSLSIREPPRVLVPVEVLAGQTVPRSLVEFLAPAEVVVLGYHVLPEQTPTEQASMQFEDRAQAAVDDVARAFVEAGREVEKRVVFTHDREKSLDRIAAEVEATAVLLPNPVGEITDVLVPLRGAVEVDRLADLVATLMSGRDIEVTLWALTRDSDMGAANRLLDDAAARLSDRGVHPEHLRTEATETEAPTRAIVDRSDEFDAIVMGEGERSLLTTVLGDTTERIAEGSVAPVLVVRGRDDTAD